MGRDISISISAKDNFTAAVTKMKTATAQFKAEGIELGEQLDKLNKTKATLTVDLTKAQAELRSARKGLMTQKSQWTVWNRLSTITTISNKIWGLW